MSEEKSTGSSYTEKSRFKNFMKGPKSERVNYDFKNENLPYIKENQCKYASIVESMVKIDANSGDGDGWPVKKILTYKNNGDAFDCDDSNGTCRLTSKVYKKLGMKRDTELCKDGDGGDTMNSFLNLYKRTGKIYELDCDFFKNKGVEALSDWDAFYGKLKEAMDKPTLDDLIEFTERIHTIGNFIYSLPGFNLHRQSQTQDFWDLALYGIFNHFEQGKPGVTSEKAPLASIIAADGLDATTRWLDRYCCWPCFVKRTYMESFCEKRYPFEPLPFFRDEARFEDFEAGGIKMPQNRTELKDCLTNINNRIKERGELMVAALVSEEHIHRYDKCTD